MNAYGSKEKSIGLMPIVVAVSVSFSIGFGVMYWMFGRGI